LILEQAERRLEERTERRHRNAERRAALVIVEEEKSRQQTAGAHQHRDACAPVRPSRPRQGAEKGALVDHVERRLVEREEIGFPYGQSKLARALERRVRKIDAEHVVAVLGEL